LVPQGFPIVGWHHSIDATAANREALWNQARRHLHPLPFPFLGSQVEDRFIILGLSHEDKALVVVHCFRAEGAIIRIISARRAGTREQKPYWERKS
jgi:uncharacterized DUF497 family protein